MGPPPPRAAITHRPPHRPTAAARAVARAARVPKEFGGGFGVRERGGGLVQFAGTVLERGQARCIVGAIGVAFQVQAAGLLAILRIGVILTISIHPCMCVHEHTRTHIQVPSLSLQRVRLSLDFLLLGDHSASSLPPFFLLQQQHQQGSETEASSCTIDVNAAEACVRAAERDGILSPVTSLGWLRLEAVEDRVRQENARREKKGWSSSSSGSGTNEGGGEGGLFGSIAAWITSGGAGKTG